jgi:hypothetical protein
MPGRITAIANPGSGPGMFVDPNYTVAINNMRNAGGHIIGYVYTSYGSRPITDVKADIDLWYRFYTIDGIFLDQQTNTTGREAFYLDLYQYIKSKQSSSIIAGNPGTDTVETYLTNQGNRVTDILCIFETNAVFLSWQPPLWCSNYTSDNFCTLPFGTPVAVYQSYVDHAASKNIGWVYCTDDDLPNPWDTLPTYFGELCDYVMTMY